MVSHSPADPKPRLRWTPELHERFEDAVTQLGGADSKFDYHLWLFLPGIAGPPTCFLDVPQPSVGDSLPDQIL